MRLNRETALQNILHLCPLAKVLINTYRDNMKLFIDRDTLLLQEGTTREIPLPWQCTQLSLLSLLEALKMRK